MILSKKHRLPAELTEEAESLAEFIKELAIVRGPALYGYEREGIAASKAFKRECTENKLKESKRFIGIIKTTLERVLSK